MSPLARALSGALNRYIPQLDSASQERPFVRQDRSFPALTRKALGYTVKLLPQPHVPVAFGFLKVNPEPMIELT